MQSRFRFWRRKAPLADALRRLDLPSQFTLDDLVAFVERQGGRPLRVESMRLPPEVTALWVDAANCDWIVLSEGLPALQRTLCTLHELAHRILGHPLELFSGETCIETVCHHLDLPKEVWANARQLRYRNGRRQEQEAEDLAIAIFARLSTQLGEEQELGARRFTESMSR